MGNSSSQLDQPIQATQPEAQHARSQARDLEQSIMDTTQDRPKKRKQKRGTKATTKTTPEVADEVMGQPEKGASPPGARITDADQAAQDMPPPQTRTDGDAQPKQKLRKKKRSRGAEAEVRDVAEQQVEAVMPSDQERPLFKKRKRQRASEVGDTAAVEETGITKRHATTPEDTTEMDKSPRSAGDTLQKELEGNITEAAKATFEKLKLFKQQQMRDAVLNNVARWHKLPHGGKTIRMYGPGEAPERGPITEETERHMKYSKKRMGELKESYNETKAVEDKLRAELKAFKASTLSPAAQADMPVQSDVHSTAGADLEISAPGQPGPKKRKKQRRVKQPIVAAPEQVPTNLASEYNPVNPYSVNPNEHITAWLASQDTPPPLQKPAEAAEMEVLEGGAEDTQAPRKKRKHVSKAQSGNEEEHQAPTSADEDESVQGDVEQSNRSRQSENNQQAPPANSTGAFTLEEKEIADRVYDRTLHSENISESQLKEQIKNWRTCGTFKAELEAALPNRNKPSLRKFAQRRFHAQERGPWTAEQDKALRNAYKSWPDKWSQISDLVDRTAADCKDRWRKQLQYGEKKSQGPWTQEEESLLQAGVEDCIEKIKTGKRRDSSRYQLDTLVNWRTVAEKLEGRRSSKQCREKYEKIKLRDTRVAASQLNTAATTDQLPVQDTEEQTYKRARRKYKQQKAKAILSQFEIGDYYDVFVEIHSSFPDHSVRFHDEDNVLWSAIGWKNPSSRFSVCHIAAALRRAALETALEEWPVKFKKAKRKLERVNTVPAKALVLAKYIEKKYPGRIDALPRTYKPELIGKSEAEIREIRREARVKRERTKKDKEVKSKDYISDSSGEEEGVLPPQSQPPSRPQRIQHRACRRTTVTKQADFEHSEADAEDDEETRVEEDLDNVPVPPNAPADSLDDELASPERDIARSASRNVRQTKNAEPNEETDSDVDKAEQASSTQEVPQTQLEPSRPSQGQLRESVPISSVNSRYAPSLSAASPSLSPKEFMKRCETAGQAQHAQYTKKQQKERRQRA